MGCTNSTPGDGPGIKPAQALGGQRHRSIVIPEVRWEVNADWGYSLEGQWRRAVDSGNHKKFRAEFRGLLCSQARKWLANAEPACAKAGTIEETQARELVIQSKHGQTTYLETSFLTMDDDFTGTVYSAAMVMAPPLTGKLTDEVWMKANGALDTEEMKAAQGRILEILSTFRDKKTNIKHALVHVFLGANMVSCKFSTTVTEPTITTLSDQPPMLANDKMAQVAIDDPEEVRGIFPASMFNLAVAKPAIDYPGCTIWDEGEFPFFVDGEPYQYPTRLLLARDFNKMSELVDATHYQFAPSRDLTKKSDFVLVRNSDPKKDPGGIVFVTLVLGTNPSALWPKPGTYTESPVLVAAEKALAEHIKTLYKNGKVRICGVRIAIGADQRRFKFVGDAPFIHIAETRLKQGNTVPEVQQSKRRQYPDLRGFLLELKEQPKHELFQSESHFQAIKQQIKDRSKQNPDFFNYVAPRVAVRSATQILSMNFPKCEISDEGEFPVILLDGTEVKICDSRLLIVKDPKQKPKSIVAAMHVVPSPRGGDTFSGDSKRNWVNSKEMKGGEYALLELLKKLNREKKVSEADCMALVMMGTDATIYQFVQGNRFIDFSDERMARFKWS